MAFVRSPDGISVELLQKGDALEPAEPWSSMENTGTWYMRSVRPSRSVYPLFRPEPDERLALHVLPGEKKGDVGHNLADPSCQRHRQL